MSDEERAEILEILSHKRHRQAQKVIMLCLHLHPQGCTIYELMDVLQNGQAYRNRRTIQRQIDYLVHSGAVMKGLPDKSRKGSIIYKTGLKT